METSDGMVIMGFTDKNNTDKTKQATFGDQKGWALVYGFHSDEHQSPSQIIFAVCDAARSVIISVFPSCSDP